MGSTVTQRASDVDLSGPLAAFHIIFSRFSRDENENDKSHIFRNRFRFFFQFLGLNENDNGNPKNKNNNSYLLPIVFKYSRI